MCTGTPADYVTLALAAGGTLLQQQSAADAASDQRRIINAGAEENARLQSKKADTITDFADKTFDPTSRDQRYEDAALKNESVLKDALLTAQGGEGEVYQGSEGNLSDDYTRGKATATANATADILKRAKLLGRSNASGLLLNDESLKGSVLASDIMGLNATSTRNNNATNAALSGSRDRGSVLGGILLGGANAAGNIFNKNSANSGVILN